VIQEPSTRECSIWVIKIKCPFCASEDIRVLDTRESDVDSTRRRRQCNGCGKRFTTYERVEGVSLTILKKDGSKQPFDKNKIRAGLEKACEKRPVTEAQLDKLVSDIESEVKQAEGELTTTRIGKLVLDHLKNIDKVAYIRFASVYREFKSYSSFEREIKKLRSETRATGSSKILQVRTRDGSIALFDPNNITDAIFKAAQAIGGTDRQRSEFITEEVVLFLEKQFKSQTIVTAEEIMDAIEFILMENGHSATAKEFILQRQHKSKRLQTKDTFIDIANTIGDYIHQKDWRVRENSNEAFSLSGLMLYASGKMIANYSLNEMYPPAVGRAHREGYIHVHDLSHGVVGYCAGWSLKNLLLWGFGGVPNKVNSKPAKHLRTVINQMVNFIGCLQMEFAGAQAFSSVDTLLAPFVRADNLTWKETKQSMQELIFSLNIPSRWGAQYPFSNLTFDWVCPSDMKNDKAIVGGKEMPYTYGDLQKEMDMINRAFMEVMIEGDAKGAVFTFPIPTYNLTKDFDWDSENAKLLFEVTAKYGLPYFQNFIGSDMDPGAIRAMCCRLNLNLLELTRRPGHLFAMGDNTGSLGVVTLNMNRLGYEAKTKEEFFERIKHYMSLSKESLEIKRNVVKTNLEGGLMPYTKRYLGHFNNHFSTIGLVGMHEACMNFLGKGLQTREGKEFAIETLNFMREVLKDFQKETGNLYNLEATPAEGCSYRLARSDKKKYGDKIYTSGKDFPYLTNSTQLPVGFTDDAIKAVEHQNDIQHLYTGGTIFHTFLGEKMTNGESCKALVKKIAYNSRIPYFSITPTFSVCPEHGYLSGEHFSCPCQKEQAQLAVSKVN